jgi:hypothetical protein
MEQLLEGYITREQCAESLNVGVRTLEKWEASNEGPPVTRVGKRPYYRVQGVKDWLIALEHDSSRAA